MLLSRSDLFLLGQCAISAAYQAGHAISRFTGSNLTITTKQGGTSIAAQVVTEVDHLSQNIILDILEPSCDRFDLGLLSEESPDNGERLQKDCFWCIDPLDGTLPFIEKIPGYSVSIALVSRTGTALIGVIYDPVTQTLYHAIRGQGMHINDQVFVPTRSSASKTQYLTFVTDKSFANDPLFTHTQRLFEQIADEIGYAGVHFSLQGGAAMNACQALTQPACCYFKFPKAQPGGGSIWDYAATACFFQELQLPVSDLFGKSLDLNPTGSTYMNHCGVLYATDVRLVEHILGTYQMLTA